MIIAATGAFWYRRRMDKYRYRALDDTGAQATHAAVVELDDTGAQAAHSSVVELGDTGTQAHATTVDLPAARRLSRFPSSSVDT